MSEVKEVVSKELLSEVLDEAVREVDFDYVKIDNEILLTIDDGFSQESRNINIHELAHKCKEWAFKQGFDIWSSSFGTLDLYHYKMNERNLFTWVKLDNDIEANAEPEAIFKAC